MKTAIIELGRGHSECIYSQASFLKDEGHSLTCVISSYQKEQAQELSVFDSIVDFKVKNSWFSLFKIWWYLRSQRFDLLILNTAQGSEIKKLMLLPYPKKTKIVGTLHNLKKLQKGHSQKVISKKVQHYYVLNDYLLEQVPKSMTNKFSSFYPIYFPKFEETKLEKPEGEKWIIIPGQVENKRRDYKGLFDQLSRVPLSKNYKFILLGRSMHEHGDGLWVKEQIKKLKLTDQFVVFDHFISNNVFHSYLKQADCIMPLIHPLSEGFKQYFEGQISGAFNMAFAYKKLLLIEQSFKHFDDFKDISVFYDINELSEKILTAIEGGLKLYRSDKWSYEFQKQNYLEHTLVI